MAKVERARGARRRARRAVRLGRGGIAPANVRVHEFGAATRAGRGARFVRALAGELRQRRPDAFVAHMIPLYVVLAAPLLKPLRVPIGLWYSHPNDHVLVRVADALATVVLSVDRSTFPLGSRKLVAIGHGIDLSEFSCADEREPHDGLHALVLGRYSSIKGLETVLRAAAFAAEAGLKVRIEAHGATDLPANDAYKAELDELVRALGVDAVLGPAVPRAAIPALFRARRPVDQRDGRRVGRQRSSTRQPRRACRSWRQAPPSSTCCRRSSLRPRSSEALRRLLASISPPSGLRALVARHSVGTGRRGGGYRAVDEASHHPPPQRSQSRARAHLLALLPRLRDSGWDVRMLMSTRTARCVGFRRALERAACRSTPFRACRRRPDRFPRLSRT